jgi:hypothetical protein
MRKSRVLLAGVGVAAAAVTTSAFTASNTLNDSVAGYDEATVSGATVTKIEYVLDTTDASLIDSIDFEATEDVDQNSAFLQFTDAAGAPIGAAIECTVSAFAAAVTPISCPTPDKAISSFVGIGLTVVE